MHNHTLVINEKFSARWKQALYLSLVLAAAAFLLYWNLDDVLWAGIFRMLSFIAFTGAVFCMLKVLEGQREIHLGQEEGQLLVRYYKKEHLIREEAFELDTIDRIEALPSIPSLPFLPESLLPSDGIRYRIHFTDTDRELNLFEFGGGPLTVTPDSHRRIVEFLAARDLPLHSNLNET